MKYYIKERHNPQFDNPYYVMCGQLSKKNAKAKGGSIYGSNNMLSFDTESEYQEAIDRLKSEGMRVQ